MSQKLNLNGGQKSLQFLYKQDYRYFWMFLVFHFRGDTSKFWTSASLEKGNEKLLLPAPHLPLHRPSALNFLPSCLCLVFLPSTPLETLLAKEMTLQSTRESGS